MSCNKCATRTRKGLGFEARPGEKQGDVLGRAPYRQGRAVRKEGEPWAISARLPGGWPPNAPPHHPYGGRANQERPALPVLLQQGVHGTCSEAHDPCEEDQGNIGSNPGAPRHLEDCRGRYGLRGGEERLG